MPDQQTAISPILATFLVLIGILVSLVLPLAVRTLKKAGGLEAKRRKPTFTERIAAAWKHYGGNKYLIILLAATAVAIFIVFILGMPFYTNRDATLAGFAWESFIKKALGQQKESPQAPPGAGAKTDAEAKG